MARSTPIRPGGRSSLALVLGLLAAYVVVVFGGALRRPFFGDDFLLLEDTRDRLWLSLWGFGGLACRHRVGTRR